MTDKNTTPTADRRLLPTTPCSPVLCYVDGPWAFFTTQPLAKQWGDDWNDAPYEHNAGDPYTFGEHDRKNGKAPWEIIKIAWEADLEAPCGDHRNGPWSVEQINAGAVAWLRSWHWEAGNKVVIPAGTTMEDFVRLVESAGGKVYLANATVEARREKASESTTD